MSEYDYDLFVIGAGSGGVRAARLSAELGARVAIAEEYRIGGTCVIRGCVPKKLLVYGSSYGSEFRDARGFGWACDKLAFDWPTLIGNVRREVDRLNGVYTRTLEKAGVARFLTRAVLEDANTIRLADRDGTISARTILVATGSHPVIPDVPGREHLITSNECFLLEKLPASLVIIGAGYIGMEFASIFNGLGVKVTVLYRGDQVLRDFDMDLRDGLAEAMRNRGVDLRMDTEIASITKEGEGYRVHLKRGDSVAAGLVMAATGRIPNTQGLGLEKIGVALGPNGRVVVDEFSKSSVDNIYAVGDVTDRKNLTPVAIHDANAFAETLFNGTPTKVDYSVIPTAVFSQPEIGTVGLSEEKARELKGQGAIDIYKTSFRPLRSMISGRDEKTLMKLVVDMKTDKVLGVHMLGPDAAEIVQMAAIALRLGATKDDFDKTMPLHPSAAEELVTLRHKWEMPAPVAGSDAAA
ncbi:glutathione-disulfide reductase [Methyloceanibacter sp.]|uniref:glutathione-disulfide reductase n=1 Tax=Methyloceanibacter sp. TaxID=1965321 RepID=UPI002D42E7C3|nr:glutathione-disulfide reductase [Methyloceanibacter sp.]HZP09688.1 glutathione-disulfide reductase [Methyloceanibacter sp.]